MKLIMQVGANVQVKIERVYIRIEDPDFPFALGILIPSINVESADKLWNIITKACENPSIFYKNINVLGFSIFLETQKEAARIDEILKI